MRADESIWCLDASMWGMMRPDYSMWDLMRCDATIWALMGFGAHMWALVNSSALWWVTMIPITSLGDMVSQGDPMRDAMRHDKCKWDVVRNCMMHPCVVWRIHMTSREIWWTDVMWGLVSHDAIDESMWGSVRYDECLMYLMNPCGIWWDLMNPYEECWDTKSACNIWYDEMWCGVPSCEPICVLLLYMTGSLAARLDMGRCVIYFNRGWHLGTDNMWRHNELPGLSSKRFPCQKPNTQATESTMSN